VNGKVAQIGDKVDPSTAEIRVDGQRIITDTKMAYIAMNKPRGVVVSTDDEKGRTELADFLDTFEQRLFHVGRLDADSEGLLLLTNDGTLANRMLHPSFGITKEYWADVEGKPTAEEMHRLTEGVEDEGETLKAESVRRLHQTGEHEHRMSIVLVEGKNREVRRMLEAVGHPVNRLIRRRFGPVALGELKPGKWRVMTDTELAGLRRKPAKSASAHGHAESTDAVDSPGGDHPPRRATHGAYSHAPAEKKPAKTAASAGKSRRNADEKGARPFAKSGARGKPGRAAKPGRAGRRDEEQDFGARRGPSARGGPKQGGVSDRDHSDRPRGAGKPIRRDAGETPRAAAARGPVRRDDGVSRRAPVRRDDDTSRRGPVRRDEDAPVRAPVRRSYGEDDAPARRPSADRTGGKPARRDEDGESRRPAAAGRGGKPGRRDESDSRRPASAGRGGASNRPTRRDGGEDSPRTPNPRFGGGRPARRDEGEGETRRPTSPKTGGGAGRGRRDDEERPTRGASAGRRTGQGGDREMKAQWPQTGRPDRPAPRGGDEGDAPRGGGGGGPRGGRPTGGDPARGGKPGGGKPGGGKPGGGKPGGARGTGSGGRDGDRPRTGGGARGGGKPGARGGGKPGPKRGGGGGRGR